MPDSSMIQELRAAGLKATAPRRAVVRVLEQRREHLSAEDIHRALIAEGVHIDLSSVYRTLTLLVRLGLVRPAGPSERHGHYEAEHEERVHFVCARCGAVTEVDLPRRAEVERAVGALARSERFRLQQFTVEATGECASCRASAERSKRSASRAPRLAGGGR
ncbi:MAG: transcriptional repressor [Armatimonadota bacterium]|nr:MAG: transcriptional repressor [Armatimonadota bacterium]